MEEQHSPVIFYQWFKRRRKALDMTQGELAERAGCSVSALRKIESGERRPSKQLAGLLAEALEIPNEERETFIRIARGELNIERLRQPEAETLNPLSDLWRVPAHQDLTEDKSVSPSSQIPIPTTPLIGREDEIAAIDRLFNEPQCRLLTLTGIGGIGKTRLAIEYALRTLSRFRGGVFYIPLTPVKSPKKIIPAIAEVLDFRFSGPLEPKEQLFNYILSDIKQETLFVFDNLEHLLAGVPKPDSNIGVADLTSEFLQKLPNVKILGTSRERLNLQGEWMYELHGLSVPPTNYVGQLDGYGSVALFVKSAQRIKADFQITVEEQLPLVEICQLVEGVPLAIELAAAWVCVLSCREIAQEINTSMDFLTTSMRDIPKRHRSIRATFDHSWNLLSDEEREVLCQLSIFHGGFDRKAAYQVTGASLNLLASLSDKSLIHRTENERYDLHEVIRSFALPHLHDIEGDPGTYERYCEYYLDFIRDRENSLKNTAQQKAVRELTDEIDNIRAAWVWAIKNEKFEQLGLAGRGFGWYFEITGLYREGIEQLELLVQALKNRPQDNQWRRLMGLMYIHQALLYFRKGEFDHAQKLYKESIQILRPIGDQALLADALIYSGIILHLSGDYERSRLSVEEGLVFSRQANDKWFEAYAIYNLGYIDSLHGHYAEGYEQMQVGLANWRTIGDPQSIALGLNFLVPTLNKLGLFEEAKAFMQESIALCEQSKNRWGLGTAYRYLGLAYIAAGQFTEAEVHLLKSLEIFGEFVIGWDIARSLTYLGDAAMMAGNFSKASKYYMDALPLSIETHSLPIALDVLAGLGDLQAHIGDSERALMLCYFVLNHPSSEDDTRTRAEQICSALESDLNNKQIRAAKAISGEKSIELIVEETLKTA